MSEFKKPKSKSLPRKKVKTQNTKSPTNDTIPAAEKININHLFAEALARHNQDKTIDKKRKLKEVSHLSLIAEEYLSSFVLIGYSLQDEQVAIFNAPTPKDEAALVDLLRFTFFDIVNNRP